MSRAGKKHNLMRPWLSANVDCKDGRFIQVGNSFLLSKRVQALSAGARITYLCMAMESGGKPTFEFPKAAAEKKEREKRGKTFFPPDSLFKNASVSRFIFPIFFS